MSIRIWQAGVLREQWDDGPRLYSRWDAGGVLVEQRAYTPTENGTADLDAAGTAIVTNEGDLRSKANAALATNVSFLANGSPSNADVLAQVRVLTRECSALIHLLLRALSSTDGT